MKPDNKAGGPWLYALGLVPVIWFALLIAPAISGGLSEIVNALPAAMNHPFKIVWCEDSVKTVLIFIAAYGLGIGIYLSSRRNYRRGEEHGSAKWGDPRAVNEQSGIFFNSAWRQFRKRGAYPTAITQNVEYLLDSVQASTMLSNSEFIVMLNQAASDRAKLAKLLNISNEQMSYVTNADAGCGLIRYGSALVPFINRFPRDTKLYALMTTKPGEGVFGGEEVPA